MKDLIWFLKRIIKIIKREYGFFLVYGREGFEEGE